MTLCLRNPTLSRRLQLSLTVCMALLLMTIGSAKAQSSDADKAVEIMKLALSCPLTPRIALYGNMYQRITNTSTYAGDEKTLNIAVHTVNRLHLLTTNEVTEREDEVSATARYQDLDPATVRVDNSAATEVLGGASETRRKVLVECNKQLACVRWTSTLTDVSPPSYSTPNLAVELCDADRQLDAEAALKALILAKHQNHRRPIVGASTRKSISYDKDESVTYGFVDPNR
jgi:hypothetical protein